MKLRTRLAVLVCKVSGAVLRRLGRGGTNLPGRLALKIDKNILGELSRGVKVTVVTGTNGKTTTSRMIEQAFADAGLRYFSNKSGANLLTGIIAVFAQHCTLSGKCPYTHALIECDEAAFRRTSEYLPVECLVVNNIFRDQLDRYGEITHTLNAIREGITHVPDATLCLNADCSLTASLAENVPNRVVWFGVNVPIYQETAHELSDAPYCIHCKTEYQYDYITYGHLGGFRCPKCGYHRQTPEVAVTKVVKTGADSSDVVLDIFGREHEVHVNLPGGYNIYNAAAAAAVSHVVGIDEETAVAALGQFECGFGRAEHLPEHRALAMIAAVGRVGAHRIQRQDVQRHDGHLRAELPRKALRVRKLEGGLKRGVHAIGAHVAAEASGGIEQVCGIRAAGECQRRARMLVEKGRKARFGCARGRVDGMEHRILLRSVWILPSIARPARRV